jgi:hypothetical protein
MGYKTRKDQVEDELRSVARREERTRGELRLTDIHRIDQITYLMEKLGDIEAQRERLTRELEPYAQGRGEIGAARHKYPVMGDGRNNGFGSY